MLGVFGGTFNPVHLGHVSLAEEVFRYLNLASVEFIPCHEPVHRESPQQAFLVSTTQRIDMLRLALQPYDHFNVNLIEVDRGGSSYMIDTLMLLSQQQDQQQTLVLILGTDAFNGLPTWKSAEHILEYCHIVVCQRPHEQLQKHFASYWVSDKSVLLNKHSGCILSLEVTPVACSSSLIREKIHNKDSVSKYLSPPVLNFIQTNQLYETTPKHA